MAISFKGAHFPQDIILMGVRWYVAWFCRNFYLRRFEVSSSSLSNRAS